MNGRGPVFVVSRRGAEFRRGAGNMTGGNPIWREAPFIHPWVQHFPRRKKERRKKRLNALFPFLLLPFSKHGATPVNRMALRAGISATLCVSASLRETHGSRLSALVQRCGHPHIASPKPLSAAFRPWPGGSFPASAGTLQTRFAVSLHVLISDGAGALPRSSNLAK